MAGSSNITGDESIIFADNASFDGTERGGKMTTNGQLWIGATVAPHVRLGNITGGAGVTISNSAGGIQVSVTGGAPVHGTGTDNHIVRWDGTGVPQIQDSNWTLQDNGSFTLTNGSTNLFEGTTLGKLTSTNTDTTPDNFIRETATNNAPIPVLQLTAQATTAGAAAFGGRIVFSNETATGGTNNDAAYIETVWDDATAGAASARIVYRVDIAGTISEVLNMRGAGIEAKTVMVMNGGMATKVTPTAISYVVLTSDVIIAVTDTSAARTITLPNSGLFNGQTFIIKDRSGAAGTNNITVTVSGGVKTIDGLTSRTISANYGSMICYWDSDSTNYFTY